MNEKAQKIFQFVENQIRNKEKEAGLSDHPKKIGDMRERTIKDFLRSFLPSFFNYKNGIITDYKGEKSKEQDIIICSPFMSFFTEKSGLFPADSVYSTIEIKSYLNKEELKKSLKNIKSLKKLEKIDGSKIQGNIFAYRSMSKKAIQENLNQLKKELDIKDNEMFDNLCVHGKNLITRNKTIKQKYRISEENLHYVNMDLGNMSLPYFLDSMIDGMDTPRETLPIFAKYLGVINITYEEWKLN